MGACGVAQAWALPPLAYCMPPPPGPRVQVLLTRDMARLAPRMDLFRLLHFYYSGLGYFVTARIMMICIYTQV